MDLLDFLDASPSPWHAAARATSWLDEAGFHCVSNTDEWSAPPDAGYLRIGAAVVAWRRGDGTVRSIRMVGAHTDSPGLRIHPHPDLRFRNWHSLGVEVYGGALLNSWLDRDLGIAGRVIDTAGYEHLIAVHDAVARVPQLAIHLDRSVNEGLVLDKHAHLRPVWSTSAEPSFHHWLAERIGATPAFYELGLFDVQPAALLGVDRSLIASGRLDNQLSCWAAVDALVRSDPSEQLSVVALFDHEEVGSASTTGAEGPLLETTLRRLLSAAGADTVDASARVFAASSCVSADNAHAIHPNYPERHDGEHAPLVNHGPAIKVNANQRYATDARTAALFARAAEGAGVPTQTFVSRNNMPCGSTIGPITATRLGIPTVDVGVPQLSMHSARELCGADDPRFLADALASYFSMS